MAVLAVVLGAATPLLARGPAPDVRGPVEATTAPTGATGPTATVELKKTSSPQGSVIYLVRHAETVGAQAMDPRNPPLSEAGLARAAELARVLADVGLTSIHSTDLARTRSTAAPVAAATGLEVQLYDPFDEATMAALIERLRGDGGRHLIVGHSNTTPALVEALDGDPVSPIDETEYDRLYVVSAAGGEVVSTLLRYGGDGDR